LGDLEAHLLLLFFSIALGPLRHPLKKTQPKQKVFSIPFFLFLFLFFLFGDGTSSLDKGLFDEVLDQQAI